MKMDLAKPPVKFPSLVGTDVEELKKYVELESRRRILRDISSFIEFAGKSNEPQVCLIEAEWGEGKTSIYGGFLKDLADENKVLFLPGKNLVNYIRRLYEGKIPLEGELDGYKFVSSIFFSLREEFEATRKGTSENPPFIPHYKNASDFGDYVNKSFNELYNYYENKNIFIFIDEFEELVNLSGNEIELVLSGLVELMNGYVKEVASDGLYRGKFHLILSITPPAYQKLQSHDKFAQTINRLFQRNSIIRIPPLSREEGVKFIHGLIEYCYDGQLPVSPIINPLEIYNTIFKISMRNPRAISEITRHILSTGVTEAKNKGYTDAMQVIRYDNFFEYLRNKTVYIYGGEIDLVNDKIWTKIENYIIDWAKYKNVNQKTIIEVLKHICAVLTPMDLGSISKALKSSDSEVLRAIELINDAVGIELRSRYGLTAGAYKLKRIIGEYYKVYDKLEALLNKYPLSRDSVSTLLNSFTFLNLNLNEGNLIIEKNFYIPDLTDKYSLNFSKELGINMKEADFEDFRERIYYLSKQQNDLEISEESYYVISPKLERLIYPAPEIMVLDFIKDRSTRIELWRQTLGDLSTMEGEFIESIPLLFASMGLSVSRDDLYDFKIEKKIGEGKKYKISTIIKSVLTTLSEETITDVSERIEKVTKANSTGKKEKLPHLVIIFYTEQITPSAERKMQELKKEFDVNILTFNLLPLQVQQLISIIKSTTRLEERVTSNELYKVVESYNKSITDDIAKSREKLEGILNFDDLNRRVKDIVNDINLEEEINSFLNEDIVLKPVSREIVKSEKDLAEFYKYYLAYPSDKISPEEVYKFSKNNILAFQYPGAKIGIVSGKDVEDSEQLFKGSAKDLEANNLLFSNSEGYYKLNLSNIENRVLKLLENIYNKTAPVETLEKSFVSHPDIPNWLFKEFYIPILIARGKIIEKENNVVKLTEFNEALNTVRYNYQRFLDNYEDFKENIKKYGYFCISKKKGYKIIIIEDFKHKIDSLYEKFNYQGRFDRELGLRLAWVIDKMAKHFFGELGKKSKKAKKEMFESGLLDILKISVKELNKIRNQLASDKKEINAKFTSLKGRLNEIDVELGEIEEISSLNNLFDKTFEIIDKEYSRESLEEIIDNEWSKLKPSEKESFPFFFRYIRGLWMLNIKIWLIFREWQESSLISKGKRAKFEDYEDIITGTIENLNAAIDKSLKTIDGLFEEKEKINNKFRELGERGTPIASLLVSKTSEPVFTLHLEGNLNSIAELNNNLESEQKRIGNRFHSFLELESKLKELNEIEEKLLKSYEDVEYLESFLAESLNKSLSNHNELKTSYEALKENLGEIGSMDDIRKLTGDFKDKLNELLDDSEKIKKQYKNTLSTKKSELETLHRRLSRLKSLIEQLDLNQILNEKTKGELKKVEKDLIKAENSLKSVIELKTTEQFNFSELENNFKLLEYNLKNIIKESENLSETEVETYMAAEEIVKSKAEVELNDLIEMLADKTEINKENIRSAIFKLISLDLVKVVVRG
ncbi:MAG: hypothetical protein ACOC5T_01785 [Elusimicrobiota bacterium]